MPSWRRRCQAGCAAPRVLCPHRDVPAADEQRSHGADVGIQSGSDAPLDAAQVSLGGRDILCAREQEGHVDRHAREDRLLDCGKAFLGPRNLDEEIGPFRLGRERSLAAARVPDVSWASRGETSKDTQPSTPLVWSWIGRNRSAACLRSSDRQLEKQRLARLAFLQFLADGVVIVVTVLDGVIEDRGVRGEPCDRELLM
jgi:hypothetical protein